MSWIVRMADEFEREFLLLDEAVQDGILAGVTRSSRTTDLTWGALTWIP